MKANTTSFSPMENARKQALRICAKMKRIKELDEREYEALSEMLPISEEFYSQPLNFQWFKFARLYNLHEFESILTDVVYICEP